MEHQSPTYVITRKPGGLYYLCTDGKAHGPFRSFYQAKQAMKEMIKDKGDYFVIMAQFDEQGKKI